MNMTKEFEAFRMRQFAVPHPVLQSLQDAQQQQNHKWDMPNGGTQSAEAMTAAELPSKRASTATQQLVPDQDRVIIHFDVDCFYCQVEEVRNPSLRGRPVAVTQKYLVVTANYEARAAGVTKLMGIADARKACPKLTLVPGEDLTPYRAASTAIRAVLSRWGPCEKLGLDESWVDVTQEVINRLASGASNNIIPSLPEAAAQWPAHIYSSSMALTAECKHRPQDLRVAATTVPYSPAPTAAPTSERCAPVQTAASLQADHGLCAGHKADAEVLDGCGSQETQATPEKAACSFAAGAARTGSNSDGGSMAGFSLSGDWQAKLYVGCMIASEMREAVFREAGYRCSAGIAFNKLLSKLVSGLHKPNDQTALPPTAAQACVARLPVRALKGVGFKAEGVLKGLGVATAGDAAALSKQQLIEGLGEKQGLWLYCACRGVDSTPVVPSGPPKTLTVEDSFKGCSSWAQIHAVLKVLVPDLLERLEEDAQEHGLRRPSTLSVKWRKAGTAWHRTSASTPWPNLSLRSAAHPSPHGVVHINAISEATPSCTQPTPAQVNIVTAAALRVLKQHLTGSFNLTLLNIGATGFKDAAVAAAGAGGIKRFLQQTEAAPDTTAATPKPAEAFADAAVLLQSALNSAVARRDYALLNHASVSGLSAHEGTSQQQGKGAAVARPVLLSKRQERRMLEQALQRQQQQCRNSTEVLMPVQGELRVLGQQSNLLADSPPRKRARLQEALQQQQQQHGGLQQEDHCIQLHLAAVLQHPAQQQQCHQKTPCLQKQQLGAVHEHQLQQQLPQSPALRGDVEAGACSTGDAAGCSSAFEIHDLAGWGCFSCEVLEGFEEGGNSGNSNTYGDL